MDAELRIELERMFKSIPEEYRPAYAEKFAENYSADNRLRNRNRLD